MPAGARAEPQRASSRPARSANRGQRSSSSGWNGWRGRAAEQLDGASSTAAAAPARRRRPAAVELGERVLRRGELARSRSRGRSASRCARPSARGPARSRARCGTRCRQYGSSSCAASTGVTPRVSTSRRPSSASRSQHASDGQVRGRPRLVEPLLADRPGAVVGEPGQVGVQHDGSRCRPAPGSDGGRSRPHRDQPAGRAPRRASPQVEVRGGEPSDEARELGVPRRRAEHRGDLGRDEAGAVRLLPRGDRVAVVQPVDDHVGEPRRLQRSCSCSASNSSTWNGFVGFSPRPRPGENTGRLGVVTTTAPPGRSTRAQSRGTRAGPRGARRPAASREDRRNGRPAAASRGWRAPSAPSRTPHARAGPRRVVLERHHRAGAGRAQHRPRRSPRRCRPRPRLRRGRDRRGRSTTQAYAASCRANQYSSPRTPGSVRSPVSGRGWLTPPDPRRRSPQGEPDAALVRCQRLRSGDLPAHGGRVAVGHARARP